MIETSGLAHLSLYVADLDRSVKFYQSVFGLEFLREHRGTIRGDPNAHQISLGTPGKADVLTLIHAKGAPVESGGMSHFAFILRVDAQLDAAIEEVVRAGGALIKRGESEEDEILERYAYVSDPDGYVLELNAQRVLLSSRRLERVRSDYAEMIRQRGRIRSKRLVRALAEVPREQFLGKGPWQLSTMTGIEQTPDDDPAHVYADVAVRIDPERKANNGMPVGVVRWLDALDLREGDTAIHAGCGTGYYTALIASVVGAAGKVIAVELDPGLAARSRANLKRFPQVRVLAADITKCEIEPADAIMFNAGATHPLDRWLDALNDGGRLVFPLIQWPEGADWGRRNDPRAGWGVEMKIQRSGSSYSAACLGNVVIFPCLGALSAEADRLLQEALRRPPSAIRSFRRDSHEKEPECWLHGAGYCFSIRGL
ncbi:MAG: VOC family protein [Candidatus Binataceae bacterium]